VKAGDLPTDVVGMLEQAWRAPGYCVPNPETYPWQWCWDSCFHAIIWARVDLPRAIAELEAVFSAQCPGGFVPHMTYHGNPAAARDLWHQDGHSSITNPPMYGHALRVVSEAGAMLPEQLVRAAAKGFRWLLEHRRRNNGLLVVCHPWESGCDDTPRWDAFTPGPFRKPDWDRVKRTVLGPAVLHQGGIVSNPAFEVAAASFNALVAFNLREFAVIDPDGPWHGHAEDLERALADRWNGSTWVDGDHPAADAPTLEALLGVLGDPRDQVWAALIDADRHAGQFGLWQVSREHPGVDPDGYWRGASWAPLEYLFWLAARRHGRPDLAARLAHGFVRGAVTSGLAEYWNPSTGAAHGAQPQSWTGLALVVHDWLAEETPPS